MLQFRILAIGNDFEDSGRRALLCQSIVKDELGFNSLGHQFHWEINKESFTEEIQTKVQTLVEDKTLVNRPFTLATVKRTNPRTGEMITKMIAVPE